MSMDRFLHGLEKFRVRLIKHPMGVLNLFLDKLECHAAPRDFALIRGYQKHEYQIYGKTEQNSFFSAL